MTFSPIRCFAVLVILMTSAAVARGDTVWIASGAGGAGNAIQMGGVQIQSIQDGRLVYQAAGGRASAREVAQIARVTADNEPALNAAEDALAKNQLDVATESFRKALASSAKEWVKVWSARRLAEVAPRANRFDAAASGYIALLVRDPARAAELKPQLPPAQSTFLNSAINEATATLATPTLTPAAKEALQAFVGELQQAKAGGGGGGADPAAKPGASAPGADVMAAPNAATGGQPAAEAAPGNVAAAANAAAASAANQQLARQRLDAAGAALERKDFAAAVNEIKTNAKLFTEPRDQAQALYFLAEAQTGIARAKNDVPSWQDAALAYMRVVAHFQDAAPPELRPFVARSMLKAAQIQETLREPAAARTLYDQLVQQFPSDPAANDARAALERLKAKP